jgi:tRNA(adenine34) deaminase
MRRALEVAAGPPAPGGPGVTGGPGPPGTASGVSGASAAPAVSAARAVSADSGDDAVDVPVGAVVYGPDGRELATGRNERERSGDPTAHAEIVAIRRAAAVRGDGWHLDGCALVVTLEPCTMCAGALVLARVHTLVFGAWEPKTGAVGSLWDVVRDRRLTHRPEVHSGVLEAECAALLRDFFRDRR